MPQESPHPISTPNTFLKPAVFDTTPSASALVLEDTMRKDRIPGKAGLTPIRKREREQNKESKQEGKKQKKRKKESE
jgi:hypothetical protein